MKRADINPSFSQSLKDWICEKENIWNWDEKHKICLGFDDKTIKVLQPLFKMMHLCIRYHKNKRVELSEIKVEEGVIKGIKLVFIGNTTLRDLQKNIKFLKDLVLGLCIYRTKRPGSMRKEIKNVQTELLIINNFLRMCKMVEDIKNPTDLDKAFYFAAFATQNPIVFSKRDHILFALKAWNIRKMNEEKFDKSLESGEYDQFLNEKNAKMPGILEISTYKHDENNPRYVKSGESVVLYWNIERHCQDIIGYLDEYGDPMFRYYTVSDLHDLAYLLLFDMVPFLWYDMAHKFHPGFVFRSNRKYQWILDQAPLLWKLD